MEIKDKPSVIFGNPIDKKTIKQGLKSKKKFLKNNTSIENNVTKEPNITFLIVLNGVHNLN